VPTAHLVKDKTPAGADSAYGVYASSNLYLDESHTRSTTVFKDAL
jgi:hypothetical protein